MGSAQPGFCSRHRSDLASKLKFYGLWQYVKAFDAATTQDIALAWLHGELKKEWLCPLTILMLELQAKANRMAAQATGQMGAHVRTCPLCSIQRFADDDAADVKVLKGMIAQVIIPLLQTNDVMPFSSEHHVKQPVLGGVRPLIVVRR